MTQSRRADRVRDLALLSLSGAGTCLATSALRRDLRYLAGEPYHGATCPDGGPFDCGGLAAHEGAWLLGVPAGVLGVAGFLVLCGLSLAAVLVRGTERAAAWSAAAVLASAALALDSIVAARTIPDLGRLGVEHAASWAVLLSVAVLAWRTLRRLRPVSAGWGRGRWRRLLPAPSELWSGRDGDYYKGVLKAGIWLAVALGAAGFCGGALRESRDVRALAREEVEELLPRRAHAPPDVGAAALDGLPSVGPPGASLTIAVAVDFRQPAYGQLARELDLVRRARPRDVRLVFVNAPVGPDGPRHAPPGAAGGPSWLARGAEVARRRGLFSEYHDLVLRRRLGERFELDALARGLRRLGADVDAFLEEVEHDDVRAAVERGRELAVSHGMGHVPSFAIDGYVWRGPVSPLGLRWMARAVLEEPERR